MYVVGNYYQLSWWLEWSFGLGGLPERPSGFLRSPAFPPCSLTSASDSILCHHNKVLSCSDLALVRHW